MKRYNAEQLKSDVKARAEAIRGIISENPDDSIHSLTNKCMRSNIPTRFDEVKALRLEHRKAATQAWMKEPLKHPMAAQLEKVIKEVAKEVVTPAPAPKPVIPSVGPRVTWVHPKPAPVMTAISNESTKVSQLLAEAQRQKEIGLEQERTRVAKEEREKQRAAVPPVIPTKPVVPPPAAAPGQSVVQPEERLYVLPPGIKLPADKPEYARGHERKSADGTLARHTYLEDVLLDNPDITSPEAYAAVRVKFGVGVDNYTILDAMHRVREAAGLPSTKLNLGRVSPKAQQHADRQARKQAAPVVKPAPPAPVVQAPVVKAAPVSAPVQPPLGPTTNTALEPSAVASVPNDPTVYVRGVLTIEGRTMPEMKTTLSKLGDFIEWHRLQGCDVSKAEYLKPIKPRFKVVTSVVTELD